MAEANGAATLDRTYCYDARDQIKTRGTGTGCTGGAYDLDAAYEWLLATMPVAGSA